MKKKNGIIVLAIAASGELGINDSSWNNKQLGVGVTIAAGEGNGPVNALDNALRQALQSFYPSVRQIHLTDYKVRVLDGKSATASRVRVLIESSDGTDSWTTIGVSSDLVEASWLALVDSFEYKLIKDIEKKYQRFI